MPIWIIMFSLHLGDQSPVDIITQDRHPISLRIINTLFTSAWQTTSLIMRETDGQTQGQVRLSKLLMRSIMPTSGDINKHYLAGVLTWHWYCFDSVCVSILRSASAMIRNNNDSCCCSQNLHWSANNKWSYGEHHRQLGRQGGSYPHIFSISSLLYLSSLSLRT